MRRDKGINMPFNEDMRNEELIENYGPVYGVPLRSSLPLTGQACGMIQALPNRRDLEQVRKVSERTAAGYEVLLSHYNQQIEKMKRLEQIIEESKAKRNENRTTQHLPTI